MDGGEMDGGREEVVYEAGTGVGLRVDVVEAGEKVEDDSFGVEAPVDDEQVSMSFKESSGRLRGRPRGSGCDIGSIALSYYVFSEVHTAVPMSVFYDHYMI